MTEVEMCAFWCLNSCLVLFVLSDTGMPESTRCLKVTQPCHMRSVQARDRRGTWCWAFLCLKCAHFSWLYITFTLLPFKSRVDSDWNVFWTNLTDSGFSVKYTSFYIEAFFVVLKTQEFSFGGLSGRMQSCLPLRMFFFIIL